MSQPKHEQQRHFYITTAIPYVNGAPHLGHALEAVQGDVLARHRRLRGDAVRFLRGTDDNALKNVEAAEAADLPVAEFVAAKARRFVELAGLLALSDDDFISTATDPRHRPGVERLWRACANDLYQRDYEGLYCRGCEAFVAEDDLDQGRCPEHQREPELVAERNWFFRLSRYQSSILELVESGRLRIEPEHRRNEVLAFIKGGLEDFSVSRSHERAHDWGIAVPGDPSQVIYVWFDALANYLTALDYSRGGADSDDYSDDYRDWWQESEERLHLVGKGIIRFHAVYWPAILLAAKEPLPTTVFVHDYLTVAGKKIAKSLGTAVDPVALAERYGVDALRWWFLRDVPRNGDGDFREEQLAARANELADGLGNLVNRTIALVIRNRPCGVAFGAVRPASLLVALLDELPRSVDAALAVFDLRAATEAIWQAVSAANRYVSETAPWELAKRECGGDRAAGLELDAVLATLLDACQRLSRELSPFLPDAAVRIDAALAALDLEQGRQLFPKFALPDPSRAEENEEGNEVEVREEAASSGAQDQRRA